MSTTNPVGMEVDVLRSSFASPRQADGGGAGATDATGRQRSPSVSGGDLRAIFKYRNDEGRDAILLASTTVHNDFGQLNQTLVVSLSPDNLEKMKSDANVEWFEGDGRVIYCSIR